MLREAAPGRGQPCQGKTRRDRDRGRAPCNSEARRDARGCEARRWQGETQGTAGDAYGPAAAGATESRVLPQLGRERFNDRLSPTPWYGENSR